MLTNWANDPEVARYLTWTAHASIGVTREFLAGTVASYDEPGSYHWGIELKDPCVLIGTIGVVRHDDGTDAMEAGYCIGRAWWGQGYVAEALRRVISYLFEDVGVNRIEARHNSLNPNSGAVMRKAGMRYEGTLREAMRTNQGALADAVLYAILAKDYFAGKV